MTFLVDLAPASGRTVTVDYATADIVTTADDDYPPASGTLTFAPGERSKSVDISIIGDTVIESDETLRFTLSNPVNATLPDPDSTGLIRNDDVDTTAPTVVLSTMDDLDPGTGPFTITITFTFTFTFTFTEAVSGFALEDLTVTNAAASDLETSDETVFTAQITPQADGPVTVEIAAGVAQDGQHRGRTLQHHGRRHRPRSDVEPRRRG